jgi:hypothetical protein
MGIFLRDEKSNDRMLSLAREEGLNVAACMKRTEPAHSRAIMGAWYFYECVDG